MVTKLSQKALGESVRNGQLAGLKCPCTLWDDELDSIITEAITPGDLLIILKLRHPKSGKHYTVRRYADFAKVLTQRGTSGWIYKKFIETEFI